MGILVTVLYLAFAFFLWTRLYTIMYRTHMKDFGGAVAWGNGDRVFAICWGAFVCLLWPIFLPVAVLLWIAREIVRSGILSKLENPLSRLEK